MECFELTKAQVHSLDFLLTRMAMKLIGSNNRDVVMETFGFFNFSMPSVMLKERRVKFLRKFQATENLFCKRLFKIN